MRDHNILLYTSFVYELDEKNISDYAYKNELHINCEGDNIAEFLKEKLQNVSKKKERKLCLTIAEFCGRVRIRRLRNVHGRDRSEDTKGLRE